MTWSERVQAATNLSNFEFSQLDQSILAKAFRGELVPQDPNDEPASVLLDRIRAEREASAPSRQKTENRKRKTNARRNKRSVT